MGTWDVPQVEKPWGLVCLLLNLFPSGVGTLIAAGQAKDLRNLLFGLLQLFLFFLILPWLWSVVWGVRIFLRSQ